MITLIDTYSGGWNILIIALCECIAIAYVYGKSFDLIFYCISLFYCYITCSHGQVSLGLGSWTSNHTNTGSIPGEFDLNFVILL